MEDKIKTGNFKEYAHAAGAISIARYYPRFYGKGILTYIKLAPSRQLVKNFRAGEIDFKQYTKQFLQGLTGLNKEQVYRDLLELAKPHIPRLLCYCESPNQCHRSLALKWLGY